jgi:hypothetical protein
LLIAFVWPHIYYQCTRSQVSFNLFVTDSTDQLKPKEKTCG